MYVCMNLYICVYMYVCMYSCDLFRAQVLISVYLFAVCEPEPKVFSPKFYNLNMRDRLTNGNRKSVSLLYVGRLGVEKNMLSLKSVMIYLNSTVNATANQSDVSLAFIGKGPSEELLKDQFKDFKNVVFLGENKGAILKHNKINTISVQYFLFYFIFSASRTILK